LVADPISKRAIEFAASSAPIGRALFAPPGLPADRVAYLRKIFDQMTSDPAMIEMAANRRLLLELTSGLDVQKDIETIVDTPPDIAKTAVAAFKG
jgi:tripartite-type tricarboxylate transporter receptor subunit TctC